LLTVYGGTFDAANLALAVNTKEEIMDAWGNLEENVYDIGDQRLTESQYKQLILDQKNARERDRMDTKPSLELPVTATSPLGVSNTHARDWNSESRTLTIFAYGYLAPDGQDISRIINRQRADGKHPLFTRVVLDHGDVVTGMNVMNLLKLGFSRDSIQGFAFTFDHAAHADRKNFKVVPPEPKPELSWAESRLVVLEEGIAFCRKASIHCKDSDLKDRDYWAGVVAQETAAKESSPEDAEIAALQRQIEEITGKS
jgi:hypothetical protein